MGWESSPKSVPQRSTRQWWGQISHPPGWEGGGLGSFDHRWGFRGCVTIGNWLKQCPVLHKGNCTTPLVLPQPVQHHLHPCTVHLGDGSGSGPQAINPAQLSIPPVFKPRAVDLGLHIGHCWVCYSSPPKILPPKKIKNQQRRQDPLCCGQLKKKRTEKITRI